MCLRLSQLVVLAALLMSACSHLSVITNDGGSSLSSSARTPVVIAASFIIEEWGIQFDIPSTIKDLQYVVESKSGGGYITFGTQHLTTLDAATGGHYCTADQGPLGTLSRIIDTDMSAHTANGEYFRHRIANSTHIGHYYYLFSHPQATCGMNELVTTLQTAQAAALQDAILKGVKAVP